MSLISQFYTRTKQDDARPVMTEDEIVIVIRRPNQRYGVYYIFWRKRSSQLLSLQNISCSLKRNIAMRGGVVCLCTS